MIALLVAMGMLDVGFIGHCYYLFIFFNRVYIVYDGW